MNEFLRIVMGSILLVLTFLLDLINLLIMPVLGGAVLGTPLVLIYLLIDLILNFFGIDISSKVEVPYIFLGLILFFYVVGGFYYIKAIFNKKDRRIYWLDTFGSTDIRYKKIMRIAPWDKDEMVQASEQDIAQGPKNEYGALGLLTGAIFFLIIWEFNIFLGETLGLNMRSIFISIVAGILVPLGIARLIAVATHKLLKRIKPSFYFGETILFPAVSQSYQLAERLYRYALLTLIIFDIGYAIRLMQSM